MIVTAADFENTVPPAVWADYLSHGDEVAESRAHEIAELLVQLPPVDPRRDGLEAEAVIWLLILCGEDAGEEDGGDVLGVLDLYLA